LSAGKATSSATWAFNSTSSSTEGEPLAFRADWIRKMKLNPSKLASMRVSGDSMEERLHDGDAVVIDTSQTEVLDGKVYALWYDGGERVKRLHRMPGGGLMIRSDNEAKYPPLKLTADQAQTVRIIGRVVHVVHISANAWRRRQGWHNVKF
jgi:phage repressor protein C with HTH and peptisase S24 domain